MTADQQQPAAAATPGPEQRVDEIRERHRSCDCPEPAAPHCVCSQRDDCEWPPVLDALAAAERAIAAPCSELAAERERNLPLRQRIKALQDEVDQVAGPLKRRIKVAEHAADFWKRTSFQNYERWKALRAELEASRTELAWVRHSDACGQCGSHGARPMCPIGYPLRDAWVALRALAASTPRTDQAQAQEGHG